MTKLKGLLLTEGMHGMISQVEGLAKALGLDFIHEKIELNNFWKMIPPKITPIKSFVFKNDILEKFNVVISCGRKSVIPSIFLKKKFGNKIMNIHIQDPKVSLNNFDFVIVPEHDDLKGENVLPTKGAIHYLRESELDDNINYLKPKIQKEKVVVLVVGGPNKYYNFRDNLVEEIFQRIIDKAKDFYNKDQIIISDVDKKAYLSSLKLADHIVVTCDSTSMISEAAITGKPIYVADMPAIKNNYRFKKFFELFKSLDIIRNLDSSVESWDYKKLNETDRIAGYIEKRFQNYDFS